MQRYNCGYTFDNFLIEVSMNLERIYEKRKHFDKKENAAGISMAIIPVLGFLIFGLLPMVLGVLMSFFDFDGGEFFFRRYPEGLGAGKTAGTWNFSFAGFENYKYLFKHVSSDPKSGMFLETLITTLIQFISLPVCIVLSMLVAFFLSKKIKGKNAMRTIYLIPFICSSIAISLIWGEFFSKTGILNSILTTLGWVSKDSYGAVKTINWTVDRFYTVVFIINVWGGTGFQIILFTAALTNINNSYYEAAKVDGANAFQIFFKITLPAISPTTFYLFITGVIGSLQAYVTPDMVAKIGGNPAPATYFGVDINNPANTVMAYIQSLLMGADNIRVGLACAAGIVLAILIGIITIINFVVSKYWVSYD